MKYPYRVFKALKIACELDEIDQRITRIVDNASAFGGAEKAIKSLEEIKKDILKSLNSEIGNSNTYGGISWDDGDSGWQDKLRQKAR